MKIVKIVLFSSIIFLIAPGMVFGIEPPNDVVSSMRDCRDWLNSLKGKSEGQIVSVLGKSSKRETWEFQGKKQLVLVYDLESVGGKLSLYFFEQSIINVSWLQESE